ncbi:uncharacterized protein [Asterias amurensis]|uniref:uncharacterized protein n=1 Tax=Asterias amurensis TaxID=7602 RepID=UPI003AB1B0C9
MGKFWFNVLAVLLVFISSPINVVTSLRCHTCTNLAASNSLIETGLSANKACEIFDPTGVSQVECQESSNGNEVVACEKWEGSFTVSIPLLGSTLISGQKRGCALVPTSEMHTCTQSSDVTAFLSDAVNLYLAGVFSLSDVQGMYCACDRNDCNGVNRLRIARPWFFVALVLLFQAFLQFHFLC